MNNTNSPTLENTFTSKIVIGKPAFQFGYWGSLSQPCILCKVTINDFLLSPSQINSLEDLRQEVFQNKTKESTIVGSNFNHTCLKYLTLLSLDILAESSMPISGGAQYVALREENEFLMALPAVDISINCPEQSLLLAVDWLYKLNSDNLSIKDCQQDVQEIVTKYQNLAPNGLNMPRIINAANEQKIPWRLIFGQIYQFGWGSQSRLLESSFTDVTSNIGSKLARFKQSGAKALALAGIPTPQHLLVHNLDAAKKAADNIGYPVVIKPVSKDGGLGVFAGITNQQWLEKAFELVSQYDKTFLIEKFYDWQDYRVQVYEGEVFWISLRQPAKVIGDGVSKISELIQQVNQSHQATFLKFRGGSIDSDMQEWGYKSIEVDDEIERWLASKNLTLDSVPAKQQTIRLRGAANVALGGTRTGIDIKTAHPDNLELAVKASKVLRLDLAGVDLLIPDITKSYKSTGAVICEVNAQPQLSAHLPHFLMQKIFPRQGRIPIITLVGITISEQVQNEIIATLKNSNIRIAWAINTLTCYQSLCDPTVDCIVWQIENLPNAAKSSPFDKIDKIFIHLDQTAQAEKNKSLLKRCKTNIFVSDKPTRNVLSTSKLPAQIISSIIELKNDLAFNKESNG